MKSCIDTPLTMRSQASKISQKHTHRWLYIEVTTIESGRPTFESLKPGMNQFLNG